MPPKFFVTHSWKDIEFAHRLCDDLQASGLDGFFDAHSMSPGDSIPSRIERGLKECDVYIPVFSPDALKSDWCDWEIDIAITMNRTQKGQPRIIPVIAQPCNVPTRLMHLLYINFVGRYDAALDELLTKGFGLPRLPRPTDKQAAIPTSRPIPEEAVVAPSNPVDEQVVVPASGPSTTESFPTRRVALGAIILVLVIVLAVILSRLGLGEQPSLLAPHLGSTKTTRDGSLMVYVPAGQFAMSKSGAVYLDAFWISKYEVTNALYKKCMDAGRCDLPADWFEGTIPTGKENHPVGYVTWNDANDYAQWAGVRLPTEAEWEKAACWDEANKVKLRYPWGDVFDARNANTSESGIGDTTPVGKYSPQGDSPYGVSDMIGNVSEWVADWYDENYYKSSPKRNPQGPPSGQYRIVRGASALDRGEDCSLTLIASQGARVNLHGIRIAESVTP